jgi:hypothetical protein
VPDRLECPHRGGAQDEGSDQAEVHGLEGDDLVHCHAGFPDRRDTEGRRHLQQRFQDDQVQRADLESVPGLHGRLPPRGGKSLNPLPITRSNSSFAAQVHPEVEGDQSDAGDVAVLQQSRGDRQLVAVRPRPLQRQRLADRLRQDHQTPRRGQNHAQFKMESGQPRRRLLDRRQQSHLHLHDDAGAATSRRLAAADAPRPAGNRRDAKARGEHLIATISTNRFVGMQFLN